MIENILILDTETTGLDPKRGSKVIEIAAVLFNVPHRTVLQCFSSLLPCDDNPVENINHIKAQATQCDYPFLGSKVDPEAMETIWKNPNAASTLLYDEKINIGAILIEMSLFAQACIAHNAEFDKKFVATLSCGQALLNKKWICTKNNFRWPVPLKRNRLEDICNAMGIAYINAHRALNDCLLLAQCFSKIEDLENSFLSIMK